MMQQSKDFLNAAKRAGVKHIVHLGACGDNDTQVPHHSWHQFIERYIYRLGYEAAAFDEVADVFTPIIGQAFSYEGRPAEEFNRNVLAAGGEPSYFKCAFDTYVKLANRTLKHGEVFDNLPAIIGRKPKTLADFARKHADTSRY